MPHNSSFLYIYNYYVMNEYLHSNILNRKDVLTMKNKETSIGVGMEESTMPQEKKEFDPNIAIARFIHLMYEGISYSRVKVNSEIIKISFGERDTIDYSNNIIVLSKESLVMVASNYFNFFKLVGFLLLRKGKLKVDYETIKMFMYIHHEEYDKLDEAEKRKLCELAEVYKFAFASQAYSGELRNYITPESLDKDHYLLYNNFYPEDINFIIKYCHDSRNKSDENAKKNNTRQQKDMLAVKANEAREQSGSSTGRGRKKKVDVQLDDDGNPIVKPLTKRKPETALEKLCSLLRIRTSWNMMYMNLARTFLNAAESRDLSLFYKNYPRKVVKKVYVKNEDGSRKLNEKGEEIYEYITEMKDTYITQDFLDNVLDSYRDYIKYIGMYFNKMQDTHSLSDINKYKELIEKVAEYGLVSDLSQSPRIITDETIKTIESSLIDSSFQNQIKKKINENCMLSYNQRVEINDK